MPPEFSPKDWETFYVIVGSSGGALTGLLFVVVALAADRIREGTASALSAYTTPSIVHFGLVVFIGATMTMPRHSMATLAWSLALAAVMGFGTTCVAVIRILRIGEYRPVLEDWVWHGVLPIAAYIALLVAALTLHGAPERALYAAAFVSLALLVIGIHNAWDAALYSAIHLPSLPRVGKPPSESP